MILVSVAALCVAALAPFARSVIWGVPLTLFSFAMSLRAAIGSALVTFFTGALATLILPIQIAAALGAGVGGLLMLLSARRSRHFRGVALLAWRVTHEATRERAKTVLDAKLRHLAKRVPPAEYAELAHFASVPLTAIGEWKAAGEHLGAIDVDALEPSERARTRQGIATIKLQAGDLEGAQDAIDAIERPAEERVEEWVLALEALLIAVQGGADRALEMARKAPTEEGALKATWDVVRAHAFASMGKEKRARAALDAVRNVAGDQGLERAVRPVGPATDLAREMLAG